MINKILSLLRYTTSLLSFYSRKRLLQKSSAFKHILRKKNIYERETQNSF